MGIYDTICKIRNNEISINDVDVKSLESVNVALWKSLLIVRPDLINDIKNYLSSEQLMEILSINNYCSDYYRD